MAVGVMVSVREMLMPLAVAGIVRGEQELGVYEKADPDWSRDYKGSSALNRQGLLQDYYFQLKHRNSLRQQENKLQVLKFP